jgi:hypothetical protein
MVQEINTAGTRAWKNRKAVKRSSEDERTRARPRSEAFGEIGEWWADVGVFAGW